LIGEGLFLISGDNSMGKTSFIESILWGLFGDSVTSVQKEMLVRSGQSSCEVDILFDIGGTQYRIKRSLNRRKSKTGKLSFFSEAVLLKKGTNKFIPITNGPNQVDMEMQEMLGLSPEAILKTVYIKQREVDILALQEPKELRELITTLFGLDEFNRVKEDIFKTCSSVQAFITIAKEELLGLNPLREEFHKRKEELKTVMHDFQEKKSELKNDNEKLSCMPSENILTEIKNFQDSLNEKKGELQLILSQIGEKSAYAKGQNDRITRSTDIVKALEKKKELAENELKKYPPKDIIRKLQQFHIDTISVERQITSTISRLAIVQKFDPLNPGWIQHKIIDIRNEIIKLKQNEQDAAESYEKLERALTSAELLSDIKKNSVKYIQEKTTCPVCNKPVEESDKMISVIIEEIRKIDESIDPLNANIEKTKDRMKGTREKIVSSSNIEMALKNLIPTTDLLLENRRQVAELLDELGARDYNSFIAHLGFDSIDGITERAPELESDINGYNRQIEEERKRMKKEQDQYKRDIQILSECELKKAELEKELMTIEKSLAARILDMSVDSLDALASKHNCRTLDQLIMERQTLEKLIKERAKSLRIIEKSKISLERDIQARDRAIEQLEAKESQVREKENFLRHARYLRGEIDGFISNYIVEGKMAKIITQTTNAYLSPFTCGRYSINRISPTIRRTKGMESHGLEIILMDRLDNILKTKEQMSGGDATALGLALRIAISKLMAMIRPFKSAEKRSPSISSIIMDEPLSSLDSSRRYTLMNILTQDKSFRQIFLITHTEAEFGDCHSIIINDDGNGKRQINYRLTELQ
jgi:DNA repair exonuclease SbcCD ATPase subunit